MIFDFFSEITAVSSVWILSALIQGMDDNVKDFARCSIEGCPMNLLGLLYYIINSLNFQ